MNNVSKPKGSREYIYSWAHAESRASPREILDQCIHGTEGKDSNI